MALNAQRVLAPVLHHESDMNHLDHQVGEGCQVVGYLEVKKVPGNFHISAHSTYDLLPILLPNGYMNSTHIIHHLSFHNIKQEKHEYSLDNSMQISRKMEGKATLSPLDNLFKLCFPQKGKEDHGVPTSYEYFLRVVPTVYKEMSGTVSYFYQFVGNQNEIHGRMRIPAIFFRWDVEPVTVVFEEERKSFAHFLVQICAIIGGVATVAGMINAAANKATKKFKNNIGKLG